MRLTETFRLTFPKSSWEEVTDWDREQDPELILDDLRCVGERKLLGCLPLEPLESFCKVKPERFEHALNKKGLSTLLLEGRSCFVNSSGAVYALEEGKCRTHSGALYAYDPVQLQKFLNHPQNLAILNAHGWPNNAHRFTLKVAQIEATSESLYDLIALTFNDQNYRDYRRCPGGPVPWTL